MTITIEVSDIKIYQEKCYIWMVARTEAAVKAMSMSKGIGLDSPQDYAKRAMERFDSENPKPKLLPNI